MTRALVDGGKLFASMDTRGVPLEITVGALLDLGVGVTWVNFIEAARGAKWWDFQIHDKLLMLRQELPDHRHTLEQIIARFKLYVLKHPHPSPQHDASPGLQQAQAPPARMRLRGQARALG